MTDALLAARQILNDAGYAVIHRDRLVYLNAHRAFSPSLIEAIRPTFLPQMMAQTRDQALQGIAYEMREAGAFVEHDMVQEEAGGPFVIRWEACVVLPKYYD